MGRWTYQTFIGPSNQKLAVFTVYRVSQSSPSAAGDRTAFQQQYRAMSSSGILNPKPKTAILTDLSATIKPLLEDLHEIILLMDANDAPTTRALKKFQADCDLIDCFSEVDYNHRTHKKGSQRIDHIFVTKRIFDAITDKGRLPWDQPISSDHCSLFIDVRESDIFGNSSVDPARPSQRRLKSTSPRKVERYTEVLLGQMKNNNLLARLQRLYKKCVKQGHTTQRDKQKFDNLDREMTQYMLQAEKNCSCAPSRFSFSVAQKEAGQEVRKLRHRSRQLYVALKQQERNEPHSDLSQLQAESETVRQALAQAYRTLRQCQTNHESLRATHLIQVAQQAEEHNNQSTVKAIRNIETAEHRDQMFAKTKRFLKAEQQHQLDRLLVPDSSGNLQEIVDSHDIFTHLLDRGRHDFSQSEGTPLTLPHVKSILPTHHWSDAWENLLSGELPPNLPTERLDPSVTIALQALRRPPELLSSEIPYQVSTEDFASGFQAANERTASSPSGRHLGHYKAVLDNPAIMEFHATIANFALEFSLPPTRWCRALQIWLEKDPGEPKINRLRIIQLLEADFNMVLKIVWGRRMVWHAEDSHALDRVPQFGTRPGKSPQDALLLKVLSYDYIRYRREESAVFNNDAKGCYDRIIPCYGMACSRRLGVPLPAIRMMLSALFSMQFWVRNAYGVSPGFYGNPGSRNLRPPSGTPNDSLFILIGNLHGVMQGSSSGPAIWLAVHFALFSALSITVVHGFLATCPRHRSTSKRKGEAFVDDTDLWVTQSSLPSPPDHTIPEALEQLARTWHSLLQVSGGALGYDKCFWYHIRFSKNVTQKMITQTSDENVSLRDRPSGLALDIEQVPTSKGLRTLGVRLAPDGNFKDEFAHRLEQAKTFATQAQKAPFTRREATLALNCIWWPRLSYPLSITDFSKAQCEKIQRAFYPPLLSKRGFNRCMPRAVCYGPALLGGMADKNTWYEQGLLHTCLLLRHLRMPPDSLVRKQLCIAIDHLQIEAGISYPVLSSHRNHDITPTFWIKEYVASSWLLTTWVYLEEHRLSVEYPDRSKLPSLQCSGDFFLMDVFLDIRLTAANFRRVQRCRLYLRALRISDLTDDSGTRILPECWNGQPPSDRASLWDFPEQPRPPDKDFEFFWTTLKDAGKVDYAGNLRTPLGLWHSREQSWHYYFSATTKCLYDTRHTTQHIPCHMQLETRRTRRRPTIPNDPSSPPFLAFPTAPTSHVNCMPADCVPISITECATILTGIPRPWNGLPPNDDPFLGLHPTMVSLPYSLLDYLPMDSHLAIRAIRQNVTHAASLHWHLYFGGSMATSRGSIVWILRNETQDDNPITFASGYRVNPELHHSCYRFYLLAAFAGLTLLAEGFRYRTTDIRITLHTNAQAAISVLRKDVQEPPPLMEQDADLRHAIHRLGFRRATVRYTGNPKDPIDNGPHQTYIDQVSHNLGPARNHPQGSSPDIDFPCLLSPTGAKVTDTPQRFLRSQHGMHSLQKHLQEKYEWSEEIFDSIDWQAHRNALRKTSDPDKTRLLKFIHGWLPTLEHRQRYDPSVDDATCPAPNCQDIESQDHFFFCRHATQCSQRSRLMDELRTFFQESKTPQALSDTICAGITAWLSPNTPSSHQPLQVPPHLSEPSNTPAQVRARLVRAFTQQSKVGWSHFFRGRIVHAWAHAFNAASPKPAPPKWTQQLIEIVWRTVLALWTERNKLLYGDDPKAEDERTRLANQAKIREAFLSFPPTTATSSAPPAARRKPQIRSGIEIS